MQADPDLIEQIESEHFQPQATGEPTQNEKDYSDKTCTEAELALST